MFARLLVLALLLAACSATPTVDLEFPDGQAPLNEHFSFVVDIGNHELLDVNADMPSHGHGILTQPEWHQLTDGRWQVDGMLLHMPGDWEFYFELGLTDGSTKRVIRKLHLQH